MLSDEQRKVRSTGIGASETAAIMGLDPYRSAIDIYLRKLGLVEEEDSHHTKRGNYLEPALRAWASDVIGKEFEPCDATFAKPSHPLVKATPDGISWPSKAVLEIKSPGPRTWREWGEGDDAPDRYVVQVAQQMLVTGCREGYLVAFLGDDLRVYRFERDDELEDEIVKTVERFWREYVETQIPPSPDGSASYREYLERKFPHSVRPQLIRADSSTEGLMIELRKAREERDRIVRDNALLEQRIKEIIGDAEGIESPDIGSVTWRNNKTSNVTDWEALARSLTPSAEKVAAFTKKKPGSRVFRPSFKDI